MDKDADRRMMIRIGYGSSTEIQSGLQENKVHLCVLYYGVNSDVMCSVYP